MSWIHEALGGERLNAARAASTDHRLSAAIPGNTSCEPVENELEEVTAVLELALVDAMVNGDEEAIRSAAFDAFQLARVLNRPADPTDRAAFLLRIGCLAVLADRGADARRILMKEGLPPLILDDAHWGSWVWRTTLHVWLCLFRKDGWSDLGQVQQLVVDLRKRQQGQEEAYLSAMAPNEGHSAAWQLVALYHLAKASEILAVFVTQGSTPDGKFDPDEQLDLQFDSALAAAGRGGLIEIEVLVRLLSRAARTMVSNSIWTVTRAVNSRVTRFAQQLTGRDRPRPIFEMLPPQRRTLREEGLLGSGKRAVVVSLPTSSGKTLIAQFRMLQALNQFDDEAGWIAYVAPTRALVKQVAVRLRQDFEPLGIVVERVSPALEIDGIEASVLTEVSSADQFRVLVTTPEKLDLMLRGGWEARIGRPLTLIVVDEAHNLATGPRGLKLELLLATINRECRLAQFLLLTPFIENAERVARWLSPHSNDSMDLAVDWVPNDRAIMLAAPVPAGGRGGVRIEMTTVHTSRATLDSPVPLRLEANRPLGLTHSKLKNGPGALAAAVAHQLTDRGTVAVLASTTVNAWSLATTLKVAERKRATLTPEIATVKAFLKTEFGPDYALVDLLDYGIGVHHAAMSDEARSLVEWLTERGQLDVVVATTTLAQGVNFPLSSIVLASHKYLYGKDMPPEDFWNIAGRAGRVDQGDLGLVVLAANNEAKRAELETYLTRATGSLNSTLIEMVKGAQEIGQLERLEDLSWKPEWSAFLQYLAHSYRQIDDHNQFVLQIEQVLRGTLGFQELRAHDPKLARTFVRGVRRYGQKLAGKPVSLVDSTGFSMESVTATMGRMRSVGIGSEVWTSDIFGADQPRLVSMMGVLLEVPELRTQLAVGKGNNALSADTLAHIVSDWVQGRSLVDLAADYFPSAESTAAGGSTQSLSACCNALFSKITQSASWGIAALQAMSFGEAFDQLSEQDQRTLRNLPARVYYGVNTDEALALRMVGVPRQAAYPLASAMGVTPSTTLPQLRTSLRAADDHQWSQALGEMGSVYREVWRVMEGEG